MSLLARIVLSALFCTSAFGLPHDRHATLPDSSVVTRTYFLTGDLQQLSGARTYTQNYTYDTAGRMATLTTANGAVTTWHYHATSGFLTSKEYHDHSGPSYTYTAAGRVLTRTWARGVSATYGYAAGTLSTITYSDGTPSVTYGNNRLGQMSTAARAGVTRTVATRLDGQVGSESWSGGSLNGWSVATSYDGINRRSGLTASVAGQSLSQTVGYDGLSRVGSVTSGSDAAVYAYVPNTSLVDHITFNHSGTSVFTENRSFDLRDRLTSIAATGATGLPSNAPVYDRADQKTRVDLAAGDYWSYGYDGLGQVTNAKKHQTGGAFYAGLQTGYAYDGIGNRQWADYGGDTAGANRRRVTYTLKTNGLNQYDTIGQPGYVWTTGQAASDATVTVNGQSANRQGLYFSREDSMDNSAAAQWVASTVSATKSEATDSFKFYHWLPAVSTGPVYDADGNLTGDGRFIYTWDGENRLVQVQSASGGPAGAPVFTASCEYDDAGRRVRKVVQAQTPLGIKLALDRRFLYDGWNLVAEVDGDGVLARSYTWGVDVSGTWQGAGGVGGLLLARQHRGTNSGVSAVFCDHNGNVSVLADMVSHALMAQYEYDAFGKVLRATGPAALSHPIRFSTKYEDLETGLSYYGLRFYSSNLGRWLNNDPLGESGGVNLYSFLGNASVNGVDLLGSIEWRSLWEIVKDGRILSATWRGAQIGVNSTYNAAKDAVTTPSRLGKALGTEIGDYFYLEDKFNDRWSQRRAIVDALINDPCFRKQALEAIKREFGESVADGSLFANISVDALTSLAGIGLAKQLDRINELMRLGKIPKPQQAAKSGIGATGQIGETALAQLGGKPQVFFNTSQGGRYVDQLVGGIANEAKVGYQSLTPSMRLQVMKDVELIGTGKIDGAIWNFYRSPVTGKIGPSGPLGDLLNQNNIPFVLHY